MSSPFPLDGRAWGWRGALSSPSPVPREERSKQHTQCEGPGSIKQHMNEQRWAGKASSTVLLYPSGFLQHKSKSVHAVELNIPRSKRLGGSCLRGLSVG